MVWLEISTEKLLCNSPFSSLNNTGYICVVGAPWKPHSLVQRLGNSNIWSRPSGWWEGDNVLFIEQIWWCIYTAWVTEHYIQQCTKFAYFCLTFKVQRFYYLICTFFNRVFKCISIANDSLSHCHITVTLWASGD